MKKTIKLSLILLIAGLPLGGSVFGQDAPAPDVTDMQRPELPEELRGKIDVYQAEKAALRTELRETLAVLVEPTREEVRETVQTFREANADRIADQRALAAEIRVDLKEIRGDRPIPPHRRPLPPELVVRRDEFIAERQALRQERHDFFESIKDLTDEEREAAIQAFREDHRQRLQEQKELRRDLRDQIRDGGTDTGTGTGG